MKINIVMLAIALAISALIAFGFYSGNSGEAYVWLITMASGIMAFVTLSGILAVNFTSHGSTGNIRGVSVLFLIASLVSNLIFSFLSLAFAPYIIVNGIISLLFILVAYGITNTLK